MAWNWKTSVSMVIVSLLVQLVVCKPVDRAKPTPAPEEDKPKSEEEMGTGLEYDRYLKQVVEVLESDSEFRKKLETANISDIKSGAIAMHLELVNNTIRTKLDEIKRMEVQRLQELARIKMQAMQAGGKMERLQLPGHLDIRNPNSFEIKDLEHLIKKTTEDLEEVDRKRREEFKTYEMEKEYGYKKKLEDMSPEEKKEAEERHQQLKEKHKQHEKINHPGSKDQFEEVWEKEDHMEDQEFDPKTFFMMHDLNGDKMWDIQEVESVLNSELKKVYDSRNTPEEDDPVERMEEMSRMREHVFTEIDLDKDKMITMDEFLTYTGKHGENKKFEENDGWDTVDDNPAFTDEEYQEYLRQHHAQPGVVQAPEDNSLQFSPEEQLRQQQLNLQQQQMAQQGMPPEYPQQGFAQPGVAQQAIPQQGFAQQGMPQQGFAQQGVPQQGFAQQGVPQQGFGQQGVPQQGFGQQGVPQQGFGQQGMPQQGMPQQGVPQQGFAQQAAGQQPQGHLNQGQGQDQPVQNQPVQGQDQPGQGQPGQGQDQPLQGHGQPIQG